MSRSTEPSRGTGRFDVISLVTGLFFLAVAAVWGFAGFSVTSNGGWLLPLLLVGVGVIGLIAVIVSARLKR